MRDNIFIYSAIKQKKGSIHYRTTQQMDTAHLYKIVNNVFWGFKIVGLFPPSQKYQFLFSLNLVYLKTVVSLSRMFEETERFHPPKLNQQQIFGGFAHMYVTTNLMNIVFLKFVSFVIQKVLLPVLSTVWYMII